MAGGRFAASQPSYDFLAGGSPSPAPAQQSLRQSMRQSTLVKPDTGNEELRVQINTLKYELDNLRQERDLTALENEKVIRDLQVRAEADFKKAQAAETASTKAASKCEALARDLKDAQELAISEKSSLERKIRILQEQNQTLTEDVEDGAARLSDLERQQAYRINEVETKRTALQKTIDELQVEFDAIRGQLESTQERLVKKENETGNLEQEVLRLKAQGGDPETLAVIKRDLSEQVTHIRNLEGLNRDQASELKQLRKVQKSVEVVEEQKKALQTELQMMKDLQNELGEARIQVLRLEDEKRGWFGLLEEDGKEAEFSSPEDVVRALVQARIENAHLLNRAGTAESVAQEKEELARHLEVEKAILHEEVEKLKAASAVVTTTPATFDGKAKTRLERQRALAIKEVEYLRAQLKTFDTEETVMVEASTFDEQKARQISELEALVDQYRKELQTLHDDLSKTETELEAKAGVEPPINESSRKRQRVEEPNQDTERMTALETKNRKLQGALGKLEQQYELIRREHKAAKAHLKTLQEQSKTRILELRQNPTAEEAAIKLNTLNTLKEENAALLAQLRGDHNVKTVPISMIESMNLELKSMEKTVADNDKRMRRLKEIWTAKSGEFREAVASVLGYKLDFMPNGRVRVTSMADLQQAASSEDGTSIEEERSIVFDGEHGTMKISGGPNSPFAMEIRPLVKFWVEERKDVPCFLAALTLELFEKAARTEM